MTIKTIATLVSTGLHPVSGLPRHCRNDSLALTIGLALAKSTTAKFEVLHAGRADNPALLDYLALGANKIEVVPVTNETEVINNLAYKLTNTDLILTGSRAESGEDSGMLPYLLAAKLNLPVVNNALSITPSANAIEVLQFLPKGKRRRITVDLPAIVAIHPLAPVELRYAYSRQVSGEIHTAMSQKLNTDVQPGNTIVWSTQAATRKPVKLKARENKAGHARMLSAIVSESKGGTVVNEGTSVEKAQVILAYLREHHLTNF